MSMPDKRVRGGPPSHLYLLSDQLDKTGVNIKLFLFGARTHDESIVKKLFHRAVDIIHYPFLIIKERPAIVHLNSAYNEKGISRDVFFVLISWALRQKVVLKFHGSDLRVLRSNNIIWKIFTKIIISLSDGIFLLSDDERKEFRSHYPGGKYYLVRNAIDKNRYVRKYDFKNRYNIPEDKFIVLYIARFYEGKGMDDVIRSIPLIKNIDNMHFVFVGDGPEMGNAEALIKTHSCEDKVTLTGYIEEDDTVDAYLSANLMVFPTYYEEGMPMVIFHSLASRLPVITTSHRAAADWLVDRESCIFVEPKSPEQIANAIDEIFLDNDLRERILNGADKVIQNFYTENVASNFTDIYNQILNN